MESKEPSRQISKQVNMETRHRLSYEKKVQFPIVSTKVPI